jgi:8-oxo-dGTP pyrophosphatase MutT (NUDIX family)
MHSALMSRGKLQLLPALVAQPSTAIATSSGRKQVAAACYRIHDGEIDFLLVRTRKGRWIFPKGGVESGLTYAESAALEAIEEAGAHGRMEEASFATYRLLKMQESGEPQARAFLCEVTRLEPAQQSYRTPTWFPAEKAKQRLRERRPQADAKEFARVIDTAVGRIRRLRNPIAQRTDSLHHIPFESTEISRIDGRHLLHARRKRDADTILPFKPARNRILPLPRGDSSR